MRKTLILSLAVLFAVVFALPETALCQRAAASLYSRLSGMEVVKVCVADVTDSTPKKNVDVKALKVMLETALKTRKTIKFEVVPDEKDADLAISIDVIESVWMEEDPVDIITGVGPILMDALMKENYALMRAVFTVKSVKTGRVVWKKDISADITDREMTMVDSLLMIKERLVSVFMRDCFSRGHEG